MERIILPRHLYQQMLQHAESVVPMEAVGLIGGGDNLARLVVELPNLAKKDEFFADPFAQFQAEKRISEAGLKIIAIYHSHPDGGTSLSKSDRSAAINWNCAHIVIVPDRKMDENDHVRAYQFIQEDKTVEIPILLT